MQRVRGELVTGFIPRPLPGPEVIAGRFVRLERLDPAAHARGLYEANAGQDWLWDYMGYGPFATFQDYADWQSRMAPSADPCFYALRDLTTGRVGGIAAYLRIVPEHGVIEIGHIQIAPFLQRTPAATEAISLLIGWAFDVGYRRVEWKCDALNLPSMAAARRYGFSFEGIFRQHMLYKCRNRDTAWFAILDRDWLALKSAHDTWLSPSNFDEVGKQKLRLSALIKSLLPSD